MRSLACDLETFSPVNLAKSGVYPYAADPEFELLLFGYSIDSGDVHVIDLASGQRLPDEVLAALTDPGVVKWAHNAAFERVALSAWLRRHHPDLLTEEFRVIGQYVWMESGSGRVIMGYNRVRYAPALLTVPNSSNTTRCVLCATKLVKNGKTAAGTQRWKCPRCGASSSRKRQDVTRRAELDRFLVWLLGKYSQAEITGTITGRSFRRDTAWCWQIRPTLPQLTTAAESVLIDGTYLADYGLLIAVNEHQKPLAWQWCAAESEAAWAALL